MTIRVQSGKDVVLEIRGRINCVVRPHQNVHVAMNVCNVESKVTFLLAPSAAAAARLLDDRLPCVPLVRCRRMAARRFSSERRTKSCI